MLIKCERISSACQLRITYNVALLAGSFFTHVLLQRLEQIRNNSASETKQAIWKISEIFILIWAKNEIWKRYELNLKLSSTT